LSPSFSVTRAEVKTTLSDSSRAVANNADEAAVNQV
jgi:hypothetical protein